MMDPMQRAMALQGGAKPSGQGRMIRLPNGQMWNTNDPLPPEETASQPMVNNMDDGYIINRRPAGGMFGNSVPAAAAPDLMNMPTTPVARPKFFGEGGAGRNIAGYLGDFLLQQADMKPIYAPAMQAKQDWQNELEKAKTLEMLKAQLKQPDLTPIEKLMNAYQNEKDPVRKEYLRRELEGQTNPMRSYTQYNQSGQPVMIMEPRFPSTQNVIEAPRTVSASEWGQ